MHSFKHKLRIRHKFFVLDPDGKPRIRGQLKVRLVFLVPHIDNVLEKELVLEIENERTLYENEYQGGFDRVVPLPIEVGGNTGEAVQSIRDLYEKLEAAKSRLHKTTHAAEKRLEEIKRKRAEREEHE